MTVQEIFKVGQTVRAKQWNRTGEVIRVFKKSIVVKYEHSKCRYNIHDLTGFMAEDMEVLS